MSKWCEAPQYARNTYRLLETKIASHESERDRHTEPQTEDTEHDREGNEARRLLVLEHEVQDEEDDKARAREEERRLVSVS